MMNFSKSTVLLVLVLSIACSHVPNRTVASNANQLQTIGGQMVKGISVAYIHTPNKKMADWYEKTLGLKKGYGDDTWQAFETSQGSTFALDFISYPSSTVQNLNPRITLEKPA